MVLSLQCYLSPFALGSGCDNSFDLLPLDIVLSNLQTHRVQSNKFLSFLSNFVSSETNNSNKERVGFRLPLNQSFCIKIIYSCVDFPQPLNLCPWARYVLAELSEFREAGKSLRNKVSLSHFLRFFFFFCLCHFKKSYFKFKKKYIVKNKSREMFPPDFAQTSVLNSHFSEVTTINKPVKSWVR